MLIFKNKMVVHEGGVGSGFKNSTQADEIDDDGTRLFHIRGTNSFNIRAIQVKERCSSLNSGDCFILESPQGLFLWFGKGCSVEERKFTQKIFREIWNVQCQISDVKLAAADDAASLSAAAAAAVAVAVARISVRADRSTRAESGGLMSLDERPVDGVRGVLLNSNGA